MKRLDKDAVVDEISAHLAALPLFADIEDHPEYLASALEASVPLEFQTGETIIRQDEFGNSFFLIWTGSVKLEVRKETNGLVQISGPSAEELLQLGPGEMFGELSLLSGEPRTSTVTAIAPTRVIEFYRNGFERLVRYSAKCKQHMDELYHKHGKLIHLKRVPLFAQLNDEAFALVLEKADLRIYRKDDYLFRQDQPIDALYLIKDGYIRLSQKLEKEDRQEGEIRKVKEELIQAYVSEGHCFGQDGMITPGKWDQSGKCATSVEAIRITRDDFLALLQQSRTMAKSILSALQILNSEPASGLAGTGVGKTSLVTLTVGSKATAPGPDIGATNLVAMRPLIEHGYVDAESLLLMDMELCVRCGNCVRACEATHGGITRLVRRGITVARRKDVEKEGSRQFLQIPTSCFHCKDPECMIGCPTGAITRDLEREVFVQEDICIGCGNCAARCPWGNIAMFPLEETKEVEGVTKIVDLLAVKCDLCRGRESSACVYNCPTGACIRVAPREYFPELKMMGIVPIAQG